MWVYAYAVVCEPQMLESLSIFTTIWCVPNGCIISVLRLLMRILALHWAISPTNAIIIIVPSALLSTIWSILVSALEKIFSILYSITFEEKPQSQIFGVSKRQKWNKGKSFSLYVCSNRQKWPSCWVVNLGLVFRAPIKTCVFLGGLVEKAKGIGHWKTLHTAWNVWIHSFRNVIVVGTHHICCCNYGQLNLRNSFLRVLKG